jgi:hypothetical protein
MSLLPRATLHGDSEQSVFGIALLKCSEAILNALKNIKSANSYTVYYICIRKIVKISKNCTKLMLKNNNFC